MNCKSWFWPSFFELSYFVSSLAFLIPPHPLKYKSIMKMNQDLMVFFQEIICLKNKGWCIYSKPWWICRCRYTLDRLICNRNEIVYFDSFGVEYVPKEIKEFIGNKNIKASIFRLQENDSVMCGYFCIGFIDFMLAGKKLTDYTNLFSPHDLKKNDNIILSYFKNE